VSDIDLNVLITKYIPEEGLVELKNTVIFRYQEQKVNYFPGKNYFI